MALHGDCIAMVSFARSDGKWSGSVFVRIVCEGGNRNIMLGCRLGIWVPGVGNGSRSSSCIDGHCKNAQARPRSRLHRPSLPAAVSLLVLQDEVHVSFKTVPGVGDSGILERRMTPFEHITVKPDASSEVPPLCCLGPLLSACCRCKQPR